ncbi:hypothetical protein GmHk_03G007624 [Glycine max]|nr:hypothetical protein GmHk_03G007624 [Glycine max]KAH1257720.1 hypothetical protein GmHk_03G007624 [Glycine max]
MATPPASPPPPLPLPPADASASLSMLKCTRKATRLRSLATRPLGAERLVVNVDPAIGKADGPYKKKLRTYLGIIARDKVDMTYETWKKVPAAQKDLIWKDIQQGEIDPVLSDPQRPLVGEQKLMAEKTKKRLEEAAQSRSTQAIIDPLSPIRCHVKWKLARTKKTGQMTSEAAKEITEKIASQGLFVPHGRQDALTAAIGRPEHPGQGLALPPEPKVSPSGARVSTKESCVAPSGNDPETSDSDKCGLYIEENPSCLAAVSLAKPLEILDHEVDDPLALKGLDDTPQPKSKAAARWIVVKYFNEVRPLEAERLKVLHIQWAQYYLKV